jgi:prepilin-type N-terminal cleavage/methylation domain-containing protein
MRNARLTRHRPAPASSHRSDGFTLVELMVVVLAIAILLAIAIPTFLGARARSHDAAAKSSLRVAIEVVAAAGADGAPLNTPTLMAAEEASLHYTLGASTGPKMISMSGSLTAPAFAALSASGTCWAVSSTAAQQQISATTISSCRGSALSLLGRFPAGHINTVAGNGTVGTSGDGAAAIAASLTVPIAIGIGADDSVYISDRDGHNIRKVSVDGTISTVAGTGVAGFSPDGTPAVGAAISIARGLALAPDGTVYFSDAGNNRIRKIAPNGLLSTVIGTGAASSTGDGFAAIAGTVNYPDAVVLRGTTLFFTDQYSYRIRQIDLTTGIVSAFAGTGVNAPSGDGGPAALASFGVIYDMVDDGLGNLYVSDSFWNRVRKIDASSTVTTVAGTGAAGVSGDGGPATSAAVGFPRGLAVVGSSLYITQQYDCRVRRVDGGIISTVAGTSSCGFAGDGGPSVNAAFNWPIGMASDSVGNLYIADFNNHRVRRINAS